MKKLKIKKICNEQVKELEIVFKELEAFENTKIKFKN